MDAVGSSGQTTRRQGVGSWIGRHPGLLPLVVALALALLLPYVVVAAASINRPIEIGAERVSLLALAWLGAGLIVSLIVAIAGASVGGDLGATTRRLLSGSTGASGPVSVDARARGAEVVAKLFGFFLYMFVQSVLRPPFDAVGGAFAPKALVDSGYVVVVALIALALLLSLYRSARPLIQHLTWAGLDRLVPTVGYATKAPAATPAARSGTTKGSRPATPPVVAAPAIEVTRPSAAETTVAGGLPMSPALSAEVTVVGATPPVAIVGHDAKFTMIGVPPAPPASSAESPDVTMIAVIPPAVSSVAHDHRAMDGSVDDCEAPEVTFVGQPPADSLAAVPKPSVGPVEFPAEPASVAVGQSEEPPTDTIATEAASPSSTVKSSSLADEPPVAGPMESASPSDSTATVVSFDDAAPESGNPASAPIREEPATLAESAAPAATKPTAAAADCLPPADAAAPLAPSIPRSATPTTRSMSSAPGAQVDRFSFLAKRPAAPSSARPTDVEATLADAQGAPEPTSATPTIAASAPTTSGPTAPAPTAPAPTPTAPTTPTPTAPAAVAASGLGEPALQPAVTQDQPTAAVPSLPNQASAQPTPKPAAPKASQFGFLGRGASQPARPPIGGQPGAPRPTEDSAATEADRTIVPDGSEPRSD